MLGPGDRFRVFPGTWHRFTGLEDTVFFEFGSAHDDGDSYRRTESEQVSDEEWGIIQDKFGLKGDSYGK